MAYWRGRKAVITNWYMEGETTITHRDTSLLWLSWPLDGTLSSGLGAGSPCSRRERGVVAFVDGILLDGPQSTLSPHAFGMASDENSGVGSTPLVIEPATFRFVAQHLNHYATAVPRFKIK